MTSRHYVPHEQVAFEYKLDAWRFFVRNSSMNFVVDAHQHFWTYGTYQTSWMEVPPYAGDPAFQSLRRSFQPTDLTPELKVSGVHYTVTIEAADSPTENETLLANARAHDWIAGVVGWVPLEHPNKVERVLDSRADDAALVGVRHLINIEPDPDWIIRPNVLRGLQVLAARRLTFDYGILPRHLEHVPLIARRVPELRIVIDHLGKPPMPPKNSSLGVHCLRGPPRCRMSSQKYPASTLATLMRGRPQTSRRI